QASTDYDDEDESTVPEAR
nr:RecName: Full=Fibrinogen beta chain; Contains: RecName: Full=Fibrinopeptide B [Anas platyrhynchos]